MIERLFEGDKLTRRDIAVLFGGNARAFLPRVDGERIVAGCFDPEMNPRAPNEVLVHNSPNAILAAQRFIQQTSGTHASVNDRRDTPGRNASVNERGDRALSQTRASARAIRSSRTYRPPSRSGLCNDRSTSLTLKRRYQAETRV